MKSDFSNIKNIYMLGIGGIGMSALARWFKANGYEVAGYDMTETQLTKDLEKEGIDVHYHNKVGRIPTMAYQKEMTLVVYTPAIPEENTEYQYFKNEDYEMIKRSEALGLITEKQKALCVAGTHGKTTTSSLLAHLIKCQGVNCSAFLGGIAANYNSNILIGMPDEPVVIEADEYDRSFHRLKPWSSIITTVDADHLDIYGSEKEVFEAFEQYIALLQGKLIIHKNALDTLSLNPSEKVLTYGFEDSDYQASNIQLKGKKYYFDLLKNGELLISGLKLSLPGMHNVLNATAALAMCLENGYQDMDALKKGIETFKGVGRRFQIRWDDGEKVVIDDYAHHPTELEALLNTAQSVYAGKKVTIVFQPHLYTRTRDFKEQFGKSLSIADEVILLDIYPARELPIEGISSASIAEFVKKPCRIFSKNYFIDGLDNIEFEVLVMAGAGDIDKLIIETVKKFEKVKS
ncbi:MAG: UDP-N-acetylmuramate--L-alanine ligase [Cytophagales bacterium]